ncbi:Unknown protein [Striga hermonthica]|uniref:GIL1/IRKI C-terminal domain-containing protein n=1 Tax=Striga hermonthica TaxID=68872 RepID=A0A9N7R639_STRHE|nr:Unknown protein [Striga hermonthica]
MERREKGEVSRREIKAAIGKAVELRALHAALMAGDFTGAASPFSRHARNLSAQDYPVFTPSYTDEAPLPGYQQVLTEDAESWGDEESFSIGHKITGFDAHICQAWEQKPTARNKNPRSRLNSMDDVQSISSCNKCRPATISSEHDGPTKAIKKSNIIVPLTDSHLSLHSKPRSKNAVLSWLFPRLKRKNKNGGSINSPARTQAPDEISQMLNDLGIVSVENLKRELIEANESRDAALGEVAGMKSSLGELKRKLEYLENYCEELKTALKRAVQVKKLHPANEKPMRRRNLNDGPLEDPILPVDEQVMVEGFLQMVSESRLSVKQFCKTLTAQIEHNHDPALIDNLNSILQPYNLSLDSKYSRAVSYHIEAFINQSIYQDFENRVFRKNGAPRHLDPSQDRQARFRSFVDLRNLSWDEVLRKGTKFYSDEFSKFCDEKMSGVVKGLRCTRPWPEQLLQAFFVAAKCVWLLHLLAFSFREPLGILRVDENAVFEGRYMEDVFAERQRSEGPGRVKVMVMPGFYVLDNVLKCKVLCRYKPLS